MILRQTTRFALAAMLAITSIALTANAQQPKPVSDSAQTLNLSNTQVLRIQGLLQSQATELRSLNQEVQARREALENAIVANNPVIVSMAVLALDASEKALENTRQANQKNLLSLLNEDQKQLFKSYLTKSARSSD